MTNDADIKNDVDTVDAKEESGEVEVEAVADLEFVPRDAEQKIKKLKAELERVEQERKEYLEGWQRAKADHINYKKDEGKRFEDMARFVIGGLIEEILPVLDSFDLALGHGVTSEVEKGIILIRSQLTDILKKRGVEMIAVKAGDRFDPLIHESVGEIKSDLSTGVIAEEVQRGYVVNGRVSRPSRVKLSKSK